MLLQIIKLVGFFVVTNGPKETYEKEPVCRLYYRLSCKLPVYIGVISIVVSKYVFTTHYI